MDCDRCGEVTCQEMVVSARLRNDIGRWVVIMRLCQACAIAWHGWREDPVDPAAQPYLTTDAQLASWLQLTPR